MLPSADVARWIDELGDSPTPDTGLYQLACSVDHYCGVISPWATPLLIFGDDPADIYFAEDEAYRLFFRWIGADSLEQLSAFAFDVARDDQWEEATSLTIRDADMTVMDTCTRDGDLSPRIQLTLKPGNYTIYSRYAEASNVMSIVHSLKFDD